VDRSILDSSPFIKTNVLGTHTLLDCAKKYGVDKFINIATDEVYGELGETGSFYENTPLEPNSPYSVSKTSADMLGRAYFRTFGTPVVTARPSNNYGPWQFPEKLVPVVLLKALHNEKIPVYGKGLNIREWLYVSDCADAVMTLLEKASPGSIYNIGSGQERPNIEVVGKLLSLVGKSDDLIEYVQDRPGHDFRYSLNYDKITNDLGWTPKIDFETGMKLTVDWYLENIKWAEKKIDYLRNYWQSVYKK
jgi:dTDP-glucose 4,6-dehydratase